MQRRSMWLAVAVVVVLMLLLAQTCRVSTPEILGATGQPSPYAIATLEQVRINGMNQWLLIRGHDRRQPVLLWLHGGPGAAQMPIARHYNGALETDFVVVHWDQRGAGKSNPFRFDPTTMTFEQFLADARVVTRLLQQRFGQERLLLLGHSWGTQLGATLVHEHPEDYLGYVAVAQVVERGQSHKIAYDWLLEQIEAADDPRARERLADLGEPPFGDHAQYVAFAGLVDAFGGSMDVGFGALARTALLAREYSPLDYLRWIRGAQRGSGPMWKQPRYADFDARRDVSHLNVPAFFITGERDFNTPLALTRSFVESLAAPAGSRLLPIADAAHTPFLADPDRFHAVMADIKAVLAPEAAVPPHGLAAQLDRQVPRLMARNGVEGVALAVVKDGRIAFTRAYGSSGDLRPLERGSRFRAESISKIFTAWAVMELALRGELDLDAPLSRLLPDWQPGPTSFDIDGVTPRRLLNHTAGIVMNTAPDEVITLVREPGAGFAYSNAGYVLLERLVEAVSGRDFAEHLQARILAPLGLDASTFHMNAEIAEALVTGHDRDGRPLPAVTDAPRGPAGLTTTITDLARFMAANLAADPGTELLDQEQLASMWTPSTPTGGWPWRMLADHYGYGYAIERLPNGAIAVGHGGEGSGGINWLQMIPATGDGLVILTNSKRGSPLIAEIAGLWTASRGLPDTKIHRNFARLEQAVAGTIIALALSIVWLGWRLRHGSSWQLGSRRGSSHVVTSLLCLAIAVFMLAAWWLAARQMVGHLVPHLAPWLGVLVHVTTCVLLITAAIHARAQQPDTKVRED